MALNRAIRIGSRKSDLARLQAMLVGDLLMNKGHAVEYVFKEAPGDVNLSNPLWKMSQVGVFTSFLHEYLTSGQVDVVVHSWKDLPIDPNPGTEVVAALPREDSRDLLLVRKNARSLEHLVVLTSSPRRQHNLASFLPKALPGVKSVEFKDVRGNIQTRMSKLCDPERYGEGAEPNALLVAKAAIDRFLSTDHIEFQSAKEIVRQTIDACHWVVLPLSMNPTAAAQGAIALEVSSSVPAKVRLAISSLNCPRTFQEATLERSTLKSLGGGCHQKLGCSVLSRSFGNFFSVKGLTPEGEEISETRIIGEMKNGIDVKKAICVGGNLFDRFELSKPIIEKIEDRALFIAKADALPDQIEIPRHVPVWTAGTESWFKLASRGVWVNGCADRLGESEPFGIDHFVGEKKWLKLSHDLAPGSSAIKVAPTYHLEYNPEKKIDFEGVSHIYWCSGSAFKICLEKHPALLDMTHGCGPGHTFEILSQFVPRERIIIAMSFKEFREKL